MTAFDDENGCGKNKENMQMMDGDDDSQKSTRWGDIVDDGKADMRVNTVSDR